MTALTATTEIDPVWHFFDEADPSLDRTDVLGPNSLFLSYGIIAHRSARIATPSGTFPSVVEITWYRSGFTSGNTQSEFLTINVFSHESRLSMPRPPNYDVLSISPAPIESIPLPVDYAVQISDPMHSSLSRKIREAYQSAQLDHDAAETARRAVNDAIGFVDFNLPGGKPLVMLSDDGVLSVQWRLGHLGVMLVFTGDGTGTYSIKRPGGSYAVGAKDFRLEDGLADEVRAAIDAQAAG